MITAFARLSKWLAKIGIGSYEEYRAGKKLRILLVGYNGARNTGSDVRVAAIAQQVGELSGKDQVHITVMTLDASSLSGYFDDDVELLPFSSFFPFHLYRACCSHHVAILCEGSTLKSTFANGLTLFLCEAAGRLRAAWHHEQILYKAVGDKIIPVTGDFTKADMGLNDEIRAEIKDRVSLVIHAGAEIGFTRGKQEYGDTNILGTLNAGHPGGMLPLSAAEKDSLHPAVLPDNLYVADATLLPGSMGNPPILTIMALAKKIASVLS